MPCHIPPCDAERRLFVYTTPRRLCFIVAVVCTTDLVDTEVLADVDDPRAQAGGGARLVANVVRVEVRVGHELLLHGGAANLRQVVLVKVLREWNARVSMVTHRSAFASSYKPQRGFV